MLTSILWVALGGAIGASARFTLGVALVRTFGSGFPVAILAMNVVGSFLMGVFVIWSFQRGLEQWNLFVMTGVLGGFTTFSAFSLEAFTLFERGQFGFAALYVGLSVVLSLLAIFGGAILARGIWI